MAVTDGGLRYPICHFGVSRLSDFLKRPGVSFAYFLCGFLITYSAVGMTDTTKTSSFLTVRYFPLIRLVVYRNGETIEKHFLYDDHSAMIMQLKSHQHLRYWWILRRSCYSSIVGNLHIQKSLIDASWYILIDRFFYGFRNFLASKN